jgi:hypothetical protein
MNSLLEQQRKKLIDRIDKLKQQLKSEPLPRIPEYIIDAQQFQVLETIAEYESEIRRLDEQLNQ